MIDGSKSNVILAANLFQHYMNGGWPLIVLVYRQLTFMTSTPGR